ncbi:MAG: DUF1302 domain-containing protein [Nevskiaceae bacterium]
MKSSLSKLATVIGGMLLAGSAGAVEFDMGGAAVTLSTKLSMGAAWRMSDPNQDLIGIGNGGNAFSTNGDDGNQAWEKGDMVASAVKLTSDISVTMGDFGVFVRGSGVYNQAIEDADLFDPTDYQPTAMREQPMAELTFKEKEIKDHAGTHLGVLDAYVYGRFGLFDRELLVKAGKQVLNWGESVFVQHGLNALITADVNRLRVPGWEIEEVQTPVGMVVLSFDVIENVGIEAFYQYEWKNTVIDVPGSFFSTNDFAGIGGTQANIGFGRIAENHTASVNTDPTTWCMGPPDLAGPGTGSPCIPFGSTVPRGSTVEARDDGQYGGKLSLYVPWLNDMDLAFYAANYHSRLPVLSGTSRTGPTTAADTANYFVEYPEDIQLYGLSFNTTIPALDVAVQGEYSLKVGQPLQVDDVELLLAGLGAAGQISPFAGATLGNQYLQGWRRFDVDQIDVSMTKILGPGFLGYDQLSMFVEAGFVNVADLPNPTVLAFDAPATYTLNAGTAALNPATANGLPVVSYDDYATKYSWGYKAAARFTYNNVFNLVTLEPTILFQHDVSGTTPIPIVNFVEGRQQINLLLGINYLQAWNVDLGYAMYSGADTRNLISDRDYFDLSVKYSF